jgi:H+/Cl- antiporter ClcA
MPPRCARCSSYRHLSFDSKLRFDYSCRNLGLAVRVKRAAARETLSTYAETTLRHNSMKAYLITTGAVFGLIAVMHALKAIEDRSLLSTNPGEFLSMAALGLVAAALSVWAWRLLRLATRS